jgi:hypothetical protein
LAQPHAVKERTRQPASQAESVAAGEGAGISAGFLKETLFRKKHDGNGKSAGKNDFPGGFLV